MKRRRGDGGERFIALPHWMLNGPAWLALSPNGKAVLLHLWQRHNGSNNGQLVYAVSEASKIGLSKYQAARALNELVDLGFLRMTQWSAFRLKTKEAREWAITAEPVNGQPPTKEFMSWTPSGPAPIERRKNPNKRRANPGKSKTRLHQCDARLHQCDRDAGNDPENSITVAPVQPSEAKSAAPRLHQCDTSNLAIGAAVAGQAAAPEQPRSALLKMRRRPLRFGDDAKAERTARPPRVLH